MRILVTGGAGFIGSHYVRTMLTGGYPGFDGADVTVVDALTYAGNRANLPDSHPRMTFVTGDICDQQLMRDLLPGHDAVVHFAAESHVDRSVDGAAEFVRTNVGGTHNVLEAARHTGVPRVVCVSTDEVYGSIATGSWTEDFPLLPNSPYAASKAGADLIARSFWRTYGMDVRITRCCNNYGPYQHVEKLIPRFLTNLLCGEQVPLYGHGWNIREWLHVDDHCRAVQLVLTDGAAGEIYNIGSGHELTNLELTSALLDLFGLDWERVRAVADRPGHDLRYSLNDDRLRSRLGWAPQVSFEDGLAQTAAWYADHREWWQPLREPSTLVPTA
ncbi:dTDP-glucose 4,6-dehydratase [Nonomuraea zeae]|uniref:dTDP-glucose 4,6-dehydratase n=1 Tax=Nonomuraea zeae TaxID=1642303 RepID=A0A5S4GUS7_9ACTN|nr:dTDP-glucose 4,6-dehydratase [Nonomuraea zeae]TMR36708.1 dTDP-glucose 4,6-dehydratase [Nonomuraea zeae]